MGLRIEIWNGKNCVLSVPFSVIPDGAIFREAYETKKEVIVIGEPRDEAHNCDEMGCSTLNHVLYRFPKNIPMAAIV